MDEIGKRMKLKEIPPPEKVFNYSPTQKILKELESTGWKPGI